MFGMFGIKLVGDNTPEFAFFGRAGAPSLINFPDSPEGRRIATSVPIGHYRAAPNPGLECKQGEVLRFIDEIEFNELFDAVVWTWTA